MASQGRPASCGAVLPIRMRTKKMEVTMSSLEMIDVSYAYPDEVDKFKTRKHRHVSVEDIPEEISSSSI